MFLDCPVAVLTSIGPKMKIKIRSKISKTEPNVSAEAVRSEKRGRFKELGLKMRRIRKTEEQKFPSQTVSHPPPKSFFSIS